MANVHMQKPTTPHLKSSNVLEEESGRLFVMSTDECAKQCKHSSSIRNLSFLASRKKLVIDWDSRPAWRCKTDTLDGMDKNITEKQWKPSKIKAKCGLASQVKTEQCDQSSATIISKPILSTVRRARSCATSVQMISCVPLNENILEGQV